MEPVRAPKKRELVYVKPHLWECTSTKGNRERFEVRAFGLTPSSEPVLVRFVYDAPLVIELDAEYAWDEAAARRVYQRLVELAKGPRPVSYAFLDATRPLYSAYLRGGKALVLRYDSWVGLDKMRWLLAEKKDKQGRVVNAQGIELWDGQPPMRLRVRNEKVTPDIALLIEHGLETTGWFEFDGGVVRAGRISRLDLEYVIEPSRVKATPLELCKSWKPQLKVCAVDAEAFSERSTAMPKANNTADAAFCVGVLLRHRDGREELHAFCSVKRPSTPRGVEIHFHEEEEDALRAYSRFLYDAMPDAIVTHNGMGWDEDYLYQRYTGPTMEEWPNDSRLLNHMPTLLKKEWESSAFAGMRFRWIWRPGVIHVDLLPWTKRSLNRLDSYKLDYLDRKYGGTGKLLGDEDRAKVDLEDAGGKEDDAPEEEYLEAHKIFEYYASGEPDKLKQIVVYCVGCRDERGEMVRGDCGITLRLFDKLQTWMSLTQMARVAFVQPSEVFMSGMQKRTYNQVAREAHRRGMYVTKEAPPRIPVKGAHVFDPRRGLWDLVFVFDFKGLYPSIIRRFNLCWTTYVPEKGDPMYDPGYDDPSSARYVSDERCHLFAWVEEWHEDEYEEWKQGKKKSTKKQYKGPIMLIKHRHRFLREPRGILPSNLDRLAADREVAKGEMKGLSKGSFEYDMKDKEQDAIKLIMNSAYGGLGSEKGPLPLHQAAAVITYQARCSAQKMAAYYEAEYEAQVIYGDSVTPDTPVLCRVEGVVSYRTIDEVGDGRWVSRSGKAECAPLPGLEVWSDVGFTPVLRVVRHACGKPLKRIRTRTGIIDVTTDHSLLRPDGERVSPTDVRVGERLMHVNLPESQGHQGANSQPYTTRSKLNAARAYHGKWCSGFSMALYASTDGTYCIGAWARESEPEDRIVAIEDLPPYAGDVYDLETACHHFAAGVGRMVVHNTDSAFIKYHPRYDGEIEADPHGWGKRMAKEGTGLFERPMELEFEKVFKWLFLANKKQYVGATIPPPHPVTKVVPPVSYELDQMISRGLMFVKRGAAPVMQEMQKELVLMALTEKAKGTPLKERQEMAQRALEAFSYALMSHGVPEKELTITQKIGQSYKLEGNHLNVYRKHLVERGKVVNPGDRIPYVLIEKEGAKKQGEKMELPELRKESGAPIDYLYYLEKRGIKPYDVVLEHGFKISGYMKWHVKWLKLRRKLHAELKKKFALQVESRGARDTRHLDAVARHRIRRASKSPVQASARVRKWYACLVRKKGGFGVS